MADRTSYTDEELLAGLEKYGEVNIKINDKTRQIYIKKLNHFKARELMNQKAEALQQRKKSPARNTSNRRSALSSQKAYDSVANEVLDDEDLSERHLRRRTINLAPPSASATSGLINSHHYDTRRNSPYKSPGRKVDPPQSNNLFSTSTPVVSPQQHLSRLPPSDMRYSRRGAGDVLFGRDYSHVSSDFNEATPPRSSAGEFFSKLMSKAKLPDYPLRHKQFSLDVGNKSRTFNEFSDSEGEVEVSTKCVNTSFPPSDDDTFTKYTPNRFSSKFSGSPVRKTERSFASARTAESSKWHLFSKLVVLSVVVFFLAVASVYLYRAFLTTPYAIAQIGQEVCIDIKSGKDKVCLNEEERNALNDVVVMLALRSGESKCSLTHVDADNDDDLDDDDNEEVSIDDVNKSRSGNVMLTEIANSLNEKYDDVGEDENYKVNMRNIVMAVQAKPAWNISLTCKVSPSSSSPSSSSTTTQLKRGKICNGAKYNDVISMSSGISILPLMCRAKRTLRFITFNILLGVGAMASIIGLIWLAIQLKKSHDRRKRDVHKMANEIIELMQKHSALSRKDSKVKPFIPLSHVRDALIPMADRKKKMSLWNRAIRFISENESRVEQDVQMINGEEVAIWKWVELTVDPIFNQATPTDSTTTAAAAGTTTAATSSQQNQPTTIKKSLSTSFSSASSSSAASFLPSSSSFLSKSFNAAATTTSYTAKATSACFKILNIIKDDDGDGDEGEGDYQDTHDSDRGEHFNSYEKQLGKRNYLPPLLKDSILDTCGQYHGILHIGCDRVMEPGAVFVKCVSESAASQNYNTLHGWVYEGRLVSVKYVTPLAYKMIFPDVADYMVPLKSAAQRRRSLSRERNN